MLRLQFRKAFLHLFAHLDDIRSRSGGNGYTQRGLSVVGHRVAHRGGITLFDLGNIPQPELVVLVALYDHVAYLLHLAELVVDGDAHALGTVIVISGIIDAVLPLQRGEHLGRRDS